MRSPEISPRRPLCRAVPSCALTIINGTLRVLCFTRWMMPGLDQSGKGLHLPISVWRASSPESYHILPHARASPSSTKKELNAIVVKHDHRRKPSALKSNVAVRINSCCVKLVSVFGLRDIVVVKCYRSLTKHTIFKHYAHHVARRTIA